MPSLVWSGTRSGELGPVPWEVEKSRAGAKVASYGLERVFCWWLWGGGEAGKADALGKAFLGGSLRFVRFN